MEKFLSRAVRHVRAVFPSIYETRAKRGSYHFSMAFSRTKLLAVGLNQNEKVNAKALRLARELNLPDKLAFPFLHSEEDLIGKLIGIDKLSSSLKIVNLRINRFGQLGMALPCQSCREILSAYNLDRVWYSDSNGEIMEM